MSETDFFRQPLAEMIDPRHPLAVLAGCPGRRSRQRWHRTLPARCVRSCRCAGRPVRAVRAGWHQAQGKARAARCGNPRAGHLLYLKHAYKLSDEELVERWAENVVWQHFSGMRFYEPHPPCDATQIGSFRSAIGEAGVEELFKATIDTAVASNAIKPAEFERLIVDTTVQEKAIAHPVDSRLLEIACHKVVAAAKRAGIALEQTL